MSFWNKLEKFAADLFEEPTPAPSKKKYNAQELLSLAKDKAMRISGDRLVSGLNLLDRRTTRLRISKYSISGEVYDGLDIATATIERASSSYTKLSEVQYRINLKGSVEGEDDYGVLVALGRYEIRLLVDEFAEYVIESVKVI